MKNYYKQMQHDYKDIKKETQRETKQPQTSPVAWSLSQSGCLAPI